jgi:hypothetical protein
MKRALLTDFMQMNGGKSLNSCRNWQMFAGLFGSVMNWSHTCIKILAPKFVLLNLVSSASDLLNQGSAVIQHMASYYIIKLACVQICVL